ncbi:MAG: hypothetical protein HXY24_14895, partial [Rubrivivax sp.]|nr:hypothetical protein [Rubrivivax sp.]
MALVVTLAQAQTVTVEAAAQPERCRVGGSVTYTVVATVTGNATGLEDSPPAFPGFAVIGEPRKVSTGQAPNRRLTWTYQLRDQQPGRHELAPFEIAYTAAGAKKTARSKPVVLVVEADAQARDIRPDRGLVEVPDATAPYRLLLFFLVAGSALALLTAGGAWALRQLRTRPAPPPEPERPTPAHELALSRLDELAAAGLPELGRIDEYHVRLSAIVRDYLAARYDLPAAESTTSEIAEGLYDRGVTAETLG